MPPKLFSPLWQYFDKLDTIIAICKLCQKQIRYHCSTSNLKTHLKRKHSVESETNLKKVVEDENEFAQTMVFDAHTKAEFKGYNPDGTSGESSGGEHVIYKIAEEKQVFNYHKLVVPMSMRSVYWKCFGFPANADGDVLTKSKIICLICKNVISYNRNTSNLRMHLQNKHQAELEQLESTCTPRKPKEVKDKKQKRAVGNVYVTDMNGTLVIGGNSGESANASMLEDYNATVHLESGEVGPSHQGKSSGKQVTLVVPGGESQSCTIESLHPFMIPVDSKSVCDAIAEFVATDLQLPDIVEGRGFQRLIATLKSPCEIPSRSKLVDEVIPATYDKFKEALQETLLNLKSDVALTVEEWDAATGETYVTFSVCYHQESDHNFVSRVLTTIYCPSGGDTHWNLIIDNMLEEWHIAEHKVRAVVCGSCRSDIINTMVAKGLVVLPCMVQTLQDVCSKVCFEQDDVREILVKCRSYIYTVYKHTNALAALRIQDHLMALEETPLMCDYPKVWISTYQMLESLLTRRQVLSSILDNVESTTFDREAVTLSESDWALLEDVVTVLEPFKVTALTLSEEKAPLVSLIKPLLWQLLSSHLKEKTDDSMNAQVFKGALKSLLSEKYNEPAVEQLLQISTTLDPRFKTLPNTADECRNTLGGPIKEALTALIQSTPEESKPILDPTPEKKKPRLSGMMMLLGEVNTVSSTDMSAVDRASLEIIQYQSEPTASLDQCPVTWWGRVTAKCPWLARLAHQYMCIPATAIPPARLTAEAQVSYDVRRANLTPEIVDRLIFLNSSH